MRDLLQPTAPSRGGHAATLTQNFGQTPDGGHGEKKQRVLARLSAFFERFFGLGVVTPDVVDGAPG
jgi:hypothetical protein